AQIFPSDHIIEIGPGIGTLTVRILKATPHVTGIETDTRFQPILEKIHTIHPEFRYRFEDVRTSNLEEVAEHQKYSIVSNLPYQISSQLFRMCWGGAFPPQRMTVMIQKEVAKRIIATPGSMNLLALSVQIFATPLWIRDVPSTAFFPKPDVESAIVRMDRRERPLVPDSEALLRIARMGFSGKRKQLHNSLSNGLHCSAGTAKHYLTAAGIPEMSRPQELSIEQWQRLLDTIPKI
ncbi:MAG: ribosomal RNA small subunit methyltransferase A, partial [Candidatus Kerfeldbacteria bacterium]|nr:ribosomal RNA small subunit methyltransferase A [Candidatus Kerfeldbacteria bacterium]